MFGTDKVGHGYLPYYLAECARIGSAISDNTPVIVELGVRDGSSIDMWRTLVPDAIVVGVDNSAGANMQTGENREFVLCNQDDPLLPEVIRETVARKYMGATEAGRKDEPFVDLLVDDCSHDGNLTQMSYLHLWPLVKPGGLYVIEDWYVGGAQWPSYDRSMLNLAEMLVSSVLDPDGPVDAVEYRYGLIGVRRKG